jgi:hypothetical protein
MQVATAKARIHAWEKAPKSEPMSLVQIPYVAYRIEARATREIPAEASFWEVFIFCKVYRTI